MEFLQRVKDVDWGGLGLPSDITIRVGMHTGPVFYLYDSIVNKLNYFGRNMNVAENIEPVTTPGSVFCTEQFAACLTTSNAPDLKEFVLEFVGNIHIQQSKEWEEEEETAEAALKAATQVQKVKATADITLMAKDIHKRQKEANASDDDKFVEASLSRNTYNVGTRRAGMLTFSDKDANDYNRFNLYSLSRNKRE